MGVSLIKPRSFYITDSSCNKNLLLWKSEYIRSPVYEVTCSKVSVTGNDTSRFISLVLSTTQEPPVPTISFYLSKSSRGKNKFSGSSRDPQQDSTFGFYSSTFTKICDFVIFSSVDTFPAALDCGTISCSPSTAQLGTKVSFTPSIIPLQGCCKATASMLAYFNYPRQRGRGVSDGS